MPDPIPSPDPSDPSPTSLFFSGTPTPPPSPDLDPSLSPSSWSETPDADPASEAGGGFLDWGSGLPSTEPEPDPSVTRAKSKLLRESARAAVLRVGRLAGLLLTRRGSAEREAGLYVPDSDDVRDISTPLASIIGRRIGNGTLPPDLADAIALAGALAEYGTKQTELRADLREFNAQQPDLTDSDDPGDET